MHWVRKVKHHKTYQANPTHCVQQLIRCPLLLLGPGWLNELGSWITYQLIQAYHQYGVGSHLAL